MFKTIISHLDLIGDNAALQYFMDHHILSGELDFHSILPDMAEAPAHPDQYDAALFTRLTNLWGGHIIAGSTEIAQDARNGVLQIRYSILGQSTLPIVQAISEQYASLEIIHHSYEVARSYSAKYKNGTVCVVEPGHLPTEEPSTTSWQYTMTVSGDVQNILSFYDPFSARGQFDFGILSPDKDLPTPTAGAQRHLAERLSATTHIRRLWMDGAETICIEFTSVEWFANSIMEPLSCKHPELFFCIQAKAPKGLPGFEERWKDGWLHYYQQHEDTTTHHSLFTPA